MDIAAVLLAPVDPPAAGEPTVVPWWLFAVLGLVIVAAGAVLLLRSQRQGGGGDERCPSCGRVMMAEWPQCMFCKAPRGARPAAPPAPAGPLNGHTIALDAEVTTIGSAQGSTVQLADAGVSRKHAGIRKADGGFELADLGSTNGVYVNGERVARRKLQAGDVIRVGVTEMVFKG